jgi:hypothetical protein
MPFCCGPRHIGQFSALQIKALVEVSARKRSVVRVEFMKNIFSGYRERTSAQVSSTGNRLGLG